MRERLTVWTPGKVGTGVIEVRNAEGLGGFLGAGRVKLDWTLGQVGRRMDR